MIAILVGMFLILGAFGVMAAFEGHKRTTTAVNDAMQSGNYGLYTIDKLIRSSGTGVARYAAVTSWGCGLNYTPCDPVSGSCGTTVNSTGLPTLPDPFKTTLSGPGVSALRLAPAVIFPNATTVEGTPSGSDVLMTMLGGAGFGETPIPITAAAGPTIDSTVGFVVGEWVLVGPASAGACMITKVGTGFTGSASNNIVLPLQDATVGSAVGLVATNNLVTALGKDKAAGFMMFGVGKKNPANAAEPYALMGLDLLNSTLTGGDVAALSDDVVMMRAIYLVQPQSTDPLTWTNPVTGVAVSGKPYSYAPADLLDGSTAADTALKSIRAIRVAIIVRAPLNEKDSTNLLQNSSGGNVPVFASLSAATQANTVSFNWDVPAGNFRYREIETTIPVRNGLF